MPILHVMIILFSLILSNKIDGSVNFYSWNLIIKVIYNLSDLEKINFKVIGRVIKNLSSCFLISNKQL